MFSPALYAVGFRLVMDGRYADAIASFRRASRAIRFVAGGPGESHRLQAAVYADAGNDAKSIEELETAVRLAPDDEFDRECGSWPRAGARREEGQGRARAARYAPC